MRNATSCFQPIYYIEYERPRETKIELGTQGFEPDVRAKIMAKQIRGKRPAR